MYLAKRNPSFVKTVQLLRFTNEIHGIETVFIVHYIFYIWSNKLNLKRADWFWGPLTMLFNYSS
jgi:hypothetical protein